MAFDDVKGILLSKTVWGVVLMVLGFVAKPYADALDPDSLVSMFDAVFVAVGAILGIVGRIKAAKTIKGIV